MSDQETGTVFLVGAGPGDPDLITRRGFRLLEEADTVMVDALAPSGVLDEIKNDPKIIDCGKRANGKRMPQPEIHRHMKEEAEQSRTVVRLQGGDPMVFGRGGEEVRFLEEHGIPCEVVPGVTAATSVASRLKKPLTDREIASEVTLITGHEAPEKEADGLDWHCLANCRKTLVVYMGLGQLEEISQRLIAEGSPGSTPVAVVSEACHHGEKTVHGTLRTISKQVENAELTTPATIVIGNVVDSHLEPQFG